MQAKIVARSFVFKVFERNKTLFSYVADLSGVFIKHWATFFIVIIQSSNNSNAPIYYESWTALTNIM